MDTFKLPDLGEGLPDAEIHEWHVKVGDWVKIDDPLVSMETAKAVVDVPSPQDGQVAQLFGKPGDVIKTGSPLVIFESAQTQNDQGTVVGHLESTNAVSEDNFTIGSAQPHKVIKATPNVKLLAKKLNVDLSTLIGTGEQGRITRQDVENAAQPLEGFEPLHGVRRAMLHNMKKSHQEIVPVSLFDEANIHHWPADTDITVRLIRALVLACQAEPALNAWFDDHHCARKCFGTLHLGIAIDNADGLFVPVIHHTESLTDQQLREQINQFKTSVADRSIPREQLLGATLTLSNFGKFAGRFASPIIVPPSVAIIAVGRLYEGVASIQGSVQPQRMLPISLSFDHRAVTGGEATRFLGHLINALQQS